MTVSEGAMRVVEYVPHGVLILEVASRSRPGRVTHYLSLAYNDEGDVANVGCTCEGFSFRYSCHHATSAMDLIGRRVNDEGTPILSAGVGRDE